MRKKYITSGNTALAIVLGKYLNDDGSPCVELLERLNTALDLYRSGSVRKILLSGGLANKNALFTEAEAMAECLIGKGVPATDLILERESLNTFQNARECAKIIYGADFSELYLISSAKHIYRPYFNPIVFFKHKFGLPVKIKPSFDSNLYAVIGNGETVLAYFKSKSALNKFCRENSDKRVLAKRKFGYIREGFFPKCVGNGKNGAARKSEENLRKIYGDFTVVYL